MENKNREQSLRDKLRDHQQPVDTQSLWTGIHPQIPIKKRKTILPVLLWLLLGAGLGFIPSHLSNINNYNTFLSDINILKSKLEDVSQQLESCKKNQSTHFVKKESTESETLIANAPGKTPISVNEQKPAESFHHVHPVSTAEISSPTNATDHEDNQSREIKPEKPTGKTMQPRTITIQNNPVFFFDKIPVISMQKEISPMAWFFEWAGGPAYAYDKAGRAEFNTFQVHQPLMNYQLEIGLQKKLADRWTGNLGFSYQFAASKQTYKATEVQNLFITDTTGIFIGTDGLAQVETGEVLAQRRITKTGVAYQTRHLLMIRPAIEFEILNKQGKNLSFSLGMAIPVWFHNTGSLVDARDGKTPLNEDHFIRSGWQWSATGYYEFPLGKWRPCLLLRLTHDKQKIVYNDNLYARYFWLPQAGMRLSF